MYLIARFELENKKRDIANCVIQRRIAFVAWRPNGWKKILLNKKKISRKLLFAFRQIERKESSSTLQIISNLKVKNTYETILRDFSSFLEWNFGNVSFETMCHTFHLPSWISFVFFFFFIDPHLFRRFLIWWRDFIRFSFVFM